MIFAIKLNETSGNWERVDTPGNKKKSHSVKLMRIIWKSLKVNWTARISDSVLPFETIQTVIMIYRQSLRAINNESSGVLSPRTLNARSLSRCETTINYSVYCRMTMRRKQCLIKYEHSQNVSFSFITQSLLN